MPEDRPEPKFADLRGMVVVLEPLREVEKDTVRGKKTAWEVTAHEWTKSADKPFILHTDLLCFTESIKRDLAHARREGNFLIGFVAQKGNGIVLQRLQREEANTLVKAFRAYNGRATTEQGS